MFSFRSNLLWAEAVAQFNVTHVHYHNAVAANLHQRVSSLQLSLQLSQGTTVTSFNRRNLPFSVVSLHRNKYSIGYNNKKRSTLPVAYLEIEKVGACARNFSTTPPLINLAPYYV